jgi:hypothetical protein
MATPVEVDGIFEDAVILQDMISVGAFRLSPDPTPFESLGQPGDYIDVAAIRPFQAPPPPVGDPYFDNVQLLLHMNGSEGSTTFSDSSYYSVGTSANGDAQITTGQYKFGGASAVFDGAGDYVDATATPGFNFGTGDFTVEFWARTTFDATSVSPYPRVIAPQAGTNTSGTFQIWQSATTSLGKVINAFELTVPAGSSVVVSTMQPINDGQWHHIAFTRSAGISRAFLDGVLKDTATDNNNYINAGTSGFRIAGRADLSANAFFTGNIDELRITKDVARYLDDFEIPTAAFSDFGLTQVEEKRVVSPNWRRPYKEIG